MSVGLLSSAQTAATSIEVSNFILKFWLEKFYFIFLLTFSLRNESYSRNWATSFYTLFIADYHEMRFKWELIKLSSWQWSSLYYSDFGTSPSLAFNPDCSETGFRTASEYVLLTDHLDTGVQVHAWNKNPEHRQEHFEHRVNSMRLFCATMIFLSWRLYISLWATVDKNSNLDLLNLHRSQQNKPHQWGLKSQKVKYGILYGIVWRFQSVKKLLIRESL